MTLPEPRTEPWPPETSCYKCKQPVGEPWSDTHVPQRPVCPECAWNNVLAALYPEDAPS